MEFKRLSDVEVVAEPTESANVLIEENGVIKKAPKTAVGGAGGEADLVFKVGCTGNAHPKLNIDHMTKPTIVSGSLDAVIEKLMNGEIPVVKVQYQAYEVYSGGWTSAYGAEYTCETSIYDTDVMFVHDIPHPMQKNTVVIAMSTDDPNFMEMKIYPYDTQTSGVYIID